MCTCAEHVVIASYVLSISGTVMPVIGTCAGHVVVAGYVACAYQCTIVQEQAYLTPYACSPP